MLSLWYVILVKCINCVINVIWTQILANKSGENLKITDNCWKSGLQITQKINKGPISFLRGKDYPQCYILQQLEVIVMFTSFWITRMPNKVIFSYFLSEKGYFEAGSGLLINCKFWNEPIMYLETFWLLTLLWVVLVRCIKSIYEVILIKILTKESGQNYRYRKFSQNLVCKLHKDWTLDFFFLLVVISIIYTILYHNWKLFPCLYHVLQYSYTYISHFISKKLVFLTFYVVF